MAQTNEVKFYLEKRKDKATKKLLEIYNNKLPVSNGNANFNIEVKSGIYFVDVLEPRTGQKVVTKLIIQK